MTTPTSSSASASCGNDRSRMEPAALMDDL
jgi:hypothetical protein